MPSEMDTEYVRSLLFDAGADVAVVGDDLSSLAHAARRMVEVEWHSPAAELYRYVVAGIAHTASVLAQEADEVSALARRVGRAR